MGSGCRIYPPEGEGATSRPRRSRTPPSAVAERKRPAVAVPPVGLPTANPPPPQAQDAEPLYRRAVEAEKNGNPQDAVALYNQGAGCDADFNRATQARNRANWLRDSLRNPTQNIVPGLPPGADLARLRRPQREQGLPTAERPHRASIGAAGHERRAGLQPRRPQRRGRHSPYSTQPGQMVAGVRPRGRGAEDPT